MASYIETKMSVVHVKLIDELIPVWRPVSARQNEDGSYFIEAQVIPDGEEWEYNPGDNVIVEAHDNEQGKYVIAIGLRE
ncbi:MAG: hypothetical protein EON58_02660 [Alphaproteobacteria bacterium]|nr:MAG: hypothetical protein EON58_02660 [Alphaproteobacteria bacterium]